MLPPDGIGRYTPTLSGSKRIRLIVADTALMPSIGDTLTSLTETWGWKADGDTVETIVNECWAMVSAFYDDMLIGAIFPFFTSIPEGWLLLDGSTYTEAQYPLLFAKLPAQFKSGTNFTLPDCTGRFPMGTITGTETGNTGGQAAINLTVAQLPAHNHTYIPPTISDIDVEAPGAPIPSTGIGSPTNTGDTGSGDSIDITNPYFKVSFAVYAGQ